MYIISKKFTTLSKFYTYDKGGFFLLSIIVPVKNSSLYIEKLLSSIFTEALDTTVILIDDGSTHSEKKNLERILDTFTTLVSERNNQVVYKENNTNVKNAGKARNIGLNNLKTEWVLFADSDDYFVNGWYKVVSKDMLLKDNDVVYYTPTSKTSYNNEDKIGTRHLKYRSLIHKYINLKNRRNEMSLRFHFFVPWSKLINVNFIKREGIYFDEVPVSNDVMFSLKVGMLANNIEASKSIIYSVTEREGSLISRVSFDDLVIRLDIVEKYNQYLEKNSNRRVLKSYKLSGHPWIIKAFNSDLSKSDKYTILKKAREKNTLYISSYVKIMFLYTKNFLKNKF